MSFGKFDANIGRNVILKTKQFVNSQDLTPSVCPEKVTVTFHFILLHCEESSTFLGVHSAGRRGPALRDPRFSLDYKCPIRKIGTISYFSTRLTRSKRKSNDNNGNNAINENNETNDINESNETIDINEINGNNEPNDNNAINGISDISGNNGLNEINVFCIKYN
ncbi:MAG: hypothetical protein OEV79_11260 [candidate division WOR-3 bacterium]|nr:hypothetical protein [candidate division WOR-3 bacterium]